MQEALKKIKEEEERLQREEEERIRKEEEAEAARREAVSVFSDDVLNIKILRIFYGKCFSRHSCG